MFKKTNPNQRYEKTARWLENFTEQGYKLKFNKETGWSFEWIEEDYVSAKELFYTLENIENKKNQAYKETYNKLNYELDFNFITQLAERMDQNKHKYEPYNWQKLDNVDELKQALFRHVLEVMKGNYEDDNRLFAHLESIALNCMFINYQLNRKQ